MLRRLKNCRFYYYYYCRCRVRSLYKKTEKHSLKNFQTWLFDVEYYRDLEMWIRGHSMSLKMVPFKSLGMVSYSPSIVTIAVSLAILEIFSIKEWPDLEIWVWGRSKSI